MSVFEFGTCKTDYKDGKNLCRSDFVHDEKYCASLEKALQLLGLPQPQPQDIFRGTRHDLLFLNTHGIVLRIGHTHIKDLINPAILQPLGWLEDRGLMQGGLPFCIAIYPGSEIMTQFINNSHGISLTPGYISDVLSMTEQMQHDLNDDNTGVIRVQDDDGHIYAVPLVIDIDNQCVGQNYKSEETAIRKMRAEYNAQTPGDVIELYMKQVFLNATNLLPSTTEIKIEHWEKAFAQHAPLRHAFWQSFDRTDIHSATVNTQARDAFWQTCRTTLNTAVDLNYPMWTAERDARGRLTFKRQETPATIKVSLYRPWTAQKADIPFSKNTSAPRV